MEMLQFGKGLTHILIPASFSISQISFVVMCMSLHENAVVCFSIRLLFQIKNVMATEIAKSNKKV